MMPGSRVLLTLSLVQERQQAQEERVMAFAERDRALASTSQLAPLQAALAEAQAAAAGAAAGAAEWQDKFMNERAVRRKLHEQLQVRVCKFVHTLQVWVGELACCPQMVPCLPGVTKRTDSGHRTMHNTHTQVLRGNIRVLARVRPPAPGGRSAVSFPLEGLLSLTDPASHRQREFEFDAVFGPDADQVRCVSMYVS